MSSTDEEDFDIVGGNEDEPDLSDIDTITSSSEDYTSEEEATSSDSDDIEDLASDVEIDEADKEFTAKVSKKERAKFDIIDKHKYAAKQVYSSFIMNTPESKVVNMFSKIKIIDDYNRISSPIVTIYEASEIISHRAKQIDENCPIYTPKSEQMVSSSSIEKAREEFFARKSPLLILRHMGRNIYELWDPKTMLFPIELPNNSL